MRRKTFQEKEDDGGGLKFLSNRQSKENFFTPISLKWQGNSHSIHQNQSIARGKNEIHFYN